MLLICLMSHYGSMLRIVRVLAKSNKPTQAKRESIQRWLAFISDINAINHW